MKLKTYHAYTMAEALAAVKRDLGADAVILSTRTFRRGGVLGVGSRTIIEVTASAAPNDSAGVGGTPRPRNATAAQRAYAKPASNQNLPPRSAAHDSSRAMTPTVDDQQRTKRLAMALAEQHRRSGAGVVETSHASGSPSSASSAPTMPLIDPSPQTSGSGLTSSSPAATPPSRFIVTAPSSADEVTPLRSKASISHDGIAPAARRFLLVPPEKEKKQKAQGSKVSVVTERPPARKPGLSVAPSRSGLSQADEVKTNSAPQPLPKSASPAHAAADMLPQSVQDELQAIKTMVGQVLQRQVTAKGNAPTPTMPQQLFDMYLKLLGQDISEELADQIVNDVRNELDPTELEDPACVREAVLRQLAAFIPVASNPMPEASPDHRPLTIALIGPTGVGKTTTLAKLAATFKLRHGKKVGLITSDTYRIAAVDQLRTYANIIGLPLQVVLTPIEMKQAVHSLSNCDVILIDTAGRSQNDTSRLDELRQFITAAAPHEVHLVLSGTASEKVLLREAEAFSEVGVHKIVLTKLDEAVSFGVLVNVIRQIGMQLSYVTTGQEVPDHLEVGRAERLAELVLGGPLNA